MGQLQRLQIRMKFAIILVSIQTHIIQGIVEFTTLANQLQTIQAIGSSLNAIATKAWPSIPYWKCALGLHPWMIVRIMAQAIFASKLLASPTMSVLHVFSLLFNVP